MSGGEIGEGSRGNKGRVVGGEGNKKVMGGE